LKKLILITSVFLSTSLWASPMDSVCYVWIEKDEKASSYEIEDYITENCERNNIVHFNSFFEGVNNYNYSPRGEEPFWGKVPWDSLKASWCRFDRNVFDETAMPFGESKYRKIICVLYDTKPREIIIPGLD